MSAAGSPVTRQQAGGLPTLRRGRWETVRGWHHPLLLDDRRQQLDLVGAVVFGLAGAGVRIPAEFHAEFAAKLQLCFAKIDLT